MTTMVLVGIVCFVVGVIAGAVLFMQISPEQKRKRDITRHLHDQQDELKDYQQGVVQHFVDTSRLLNQLHDSYAELHNHLAAASDELCAQSTVTPIIQPLSTNSPEGYSKNTGLVTPPLDYAPKNTPYDRGTLNEEYGLEKVKVTEP